MDLNHKSWSSNNLDLRIKRNGTILKREIKHSKLHCFLQLQVQAVSDLQDWSWLLLIGLQNKGIEKFVDYYQEKEKEH